MDFPGLTPFEYNNVLISILHFQYIEECKCFSNFTQNQSKVICLKAGMFGLLAIDGWKLYAEGYTVDFNQTFDQQKLQFLIDESDYLMVPVWIGHARMRCGAPRLPNHEDHVLLIIADRRKNVITIVDSNNIRKTRRENYVDRLQTMLIPFLRKTYTISSPSCSHVFYTLFPVADGCAVATLWCIQSLLHSEDQDWKPSSNARGEIRNILTLTHQIMQLLVTLPQ